MEKSRPYVIASKTALNLKSPIVVDVPLTSTLSKACSHRMFLPVAHMIVDPSCKRRPNDSVALTDQIRVLDIKRLESPRIGRLSDTALGGLEVALSYLFDIS